MKKTTPFIIVALFLAIIITLLVFMDQDQNMTVVSTGNKSQTPVQMVEGRFQCSECGMVINDLRFAAQITSQRGKTWFFDDHGCMAAWEKRLDLEETPVIWVPDLLSGKWIDGRTAWYSRTDSTPMMYGFGAYANKAEDLIDFTTMQTFMLRGETLANPAVRKLLLGD